MAFEMLVLNFDTFFFTFALLLHLRLVCLGAVGARAAGFVRADGKYLPHVIVRFAWEARGVVAWDQGVNSVVEFSFSSAQRAALRMRGVSLGSDSMRRHSST